MIFDYIPERLGPGSALGHAIGDSTVVVSPLPGGAAALFRFLFNLPSALQISLFVLGVLAGVALLVTLWIRRVRCWQWLTTRNRGLKIVMASSAGAVLLAIVGGGTVTWNYMQHNNGFCTGCHIMESPYRRMVDAKVVADIAQKHDSLKCHDCHQQSIFASTRQLYLWVAERPAKIGAHARIKNEVCARCHITDQKEKWQHIATTAGHRVHLESDSSKLKDLQCVTCHAQEIHRFIPANETCAQSGCHSDVKIVLGKMAEVKTFHCLACHQFTAEVPRLATRDSARGVLVPTRKECFTCHEMQERLAEFDPAKDPHTGTCGMCHNPHVQKQASEAIKSCSSAGCHSNWREIAFHAGANHKRVAENCITCHSPHQARLDASDCAGCHARVKDKAGVRKPPLPFDTTAAKLRASLDPVAPSAGKWLHRATPSVAAPAEGSSPEPAEPIRPARGKGDAPPPTESPGIGLTPVSPAPSDTFPHARHKKLSCITCHTTNTGRNGLVFSQPRGCQICHHQAPSQSDCATCHAKNTVPEVEQVEVRVTVPPHAPRERTVGFRHEKHISLRCIECHTQPVSMAPDSNVVACLSCHEKHHEANRTCATCHTTDQLKPAHQPAAMTHQACDACHTPSRIAELTPTRTLCVTCHADQDHHAPAECTTCHMLASPEAYRAHLRKPVT
ncbi:MAG: hypothetical protein ABJD11_10895 [Gemmatimonadota bacterium]